MERKTRKVLGYDVDLLTFRKAVDFVCEKFMNSEGMQIVTINPEMIEMANQNREFAKILKTSELVVPDGAGIELALRLKGIKQERIPGIDFAKELINSCCLCNFPIALIGTKEEVLQIAVERLQNEFQGLNICYSRNGYFLQSKEEEIITNLVRSNPKFVLVALGAPKQELFIHRCRKFLPNAVFIGVGGSFDVWAGAVERAPEFFQMLRLEWLYRTLKQPQRLKRIYKTLPLFVIKAIMEAKK